MRRSRSPHIRVLTARSAAASRATVITQGHWSWRRRARARTAKMARGLAQPHATTARRERETETSR
eukprot:scaffold15093_cov114-Isochrysis_galbana.AAC.1